MEIQCSNSFRARKASLHDELDFDPRLPENPNMLAENRELLIHVRAKNGSELKSIVCSILPVLVFRFREEILEHQLSEDYLINSKCIYASVESQSPVGVFCSGGTCLVNLLVRTSPLSMSHHYYRCRHR